MYEMKVELNFVRWTQLLQPISPVTRHYTSAEIERVFNIFHFLPLSLFSLALMIDEYDLICYYESSFENITNWIINSNKISKQYPI